MSLRYGVVAGVSLMALPAFAGALTPAVPMKPRPALIFVQASSDPLGAHAAVEQAQAGLSDIDATITLLDEGARKLGEAERKRALEALQSLRATRDAYHAEVESLVADVGQVTSEQIMKVRTALAASWTRFERELDDYFTAIHMDVASRKAILEARIEAEQRYWLQGIADLRTSVANVTAEKRAAIEARIAQLQARANAAQARLGKLQQAGNEALSALRKGLIDSRHLFGDTYDAVETAIDKGKQ